MFQALDHEGSSAADQRLHCRSEDDEGNFADLARDTNVQAPVSELLVC